MNIQVRYQSMTGNTKKVAVAISKAVGVEAKSIKEPVSEGADILFLGGGVYGGVISPELKEFIKNLDSVKIKKIAVFFTSAGGSNIYEEIKKLIDEKNIKTADKYFNCFGNFFIVHFLSPTKEELLKAAEFAKSLI
jgi:flavodoxin